MLVCTFAVAGVHVLGDEHAAVQHALVDRLALGQHRRERRARQDALERRRDLGLPRDADRPRLQQVDDRRLRLVAGRDVA